jgi:hypothetical protein
MPFDPKQIRRELIHPDDAPLSADGELILPDDLAALAEQLTDDASRLSARYPAPHIPADCQPHAAIAAQLVESAGRIEAAGRRRRAWRQWTLLAGGGLASALAAIATLSLASRPGPEKLEDRIVTVPPPPDVVPIDRGAAAAAIPASRVPARASLSLGDLSAPEMEAVFDLLQQDSANSGSISF